MLSASTHNGTSYPARSYGRWRRLVVRRVGRMAKRYSKAATSCPSGIVSWSHTQSSGEFAKPVRTSVPLMRNEALFPERQHPSRRALLLHRSSEGLALLPDHEYNDLHRRRGAGVVRVMDMFGRDMRTIPRLEG